MTKHNINSKKGFTIIEVVLVLAIAGLIFLMVFIALPNLQRTQRDTQRRNDLDRVSSSLIQYVTNNNKLPDPNTQTIIPGSTFIDSSTGNLKSGLDVSAMNAWQKFYYNYLLANGNDVFVDPSGAGYNLIATDEITSANSIITGATNVFDSGEEDATYNFDEDTFTIVVTTAAACSGDETAPFEAAAGARKFAVALKLEGNGIYCLAN